LCHGLRYLAPLHLIAGRLDLDLDQMQMLKVCVDNTLKVFSISVIDLCSIQYREGVLVDFWRRNVSVHAENTYLIWGRH